MSMSTITVYTKDNYGSVHIYPACDNSIAIANMLGKKTLHEYELKTFEKLGHEILLDITLSGDRATSRRLVDSNANQIVIPFPFNSR